MAGRFEELLKKAEAEKREKAGLEPLEDLPQEAEADTVQPPEEPAAPIESDHPKHEKARKDNSFVRAFVMFIALLALCGGLAYFVLIAFADYSGLNKSADKKEVTIPAGTSFTQIASILKENDLIDHPFLFNAYSFVTGNKNKYQAGTYHLSAEMGYTELAAALVLGNPRQTVKITIPEGYTVAQIATKLADNNVCSEEDFYDALVHETYDYDFFGSIPTNGTDGAKYNGRLYRLEGYLFPDTYEFFAESSGKSVVDKFLANFNSKVTAEMRAEIAAKGLTLDDVVIMASIAEKEAVNDQEKPKIVRVLNNRLESDYTRLECDSTYLYIKNLDANIQNAEDIKAAYDTYQRYGLPAGAIGNPGLASIQAAITPSDDSTIAQCFYFANDAAGNTYYSKTFAEHKAVCRKYGIGIYG